VLLQLAAAKETTDQIHLLFLQLLLAAVAAVA
jgi:hypothetical protein